MDTFHLYLTLFYTFLPSLHAAHWSASPSRHLPFVDSSETKSVGGKCTCQCEAPKIVRVEVPKIQIKYIPVVVKSVKDEIDTHDIHTVKSSDENAIVRATQSPLEYTTKHLPSKYAEDIQSRPSSPSSLDDASLQPSSNHLPSSSGDTHSPHHHSSQSQLYSSVYSNHHHHHHRQRDYKEPNGRQLSLPPPYSRDHIHHTRPHQQQNDHHHDSSHYATVNTHNVGIEYARR